MYLTKGMVKNSTFRKPWLVLMGVMKYAHAFYGYRRVVTNDI